MRRTDSAPRRSGRVLAADTSCSSSFQSASCSRVNPSTFIGVRYEDVISIDTPEGVPLELTLAGVGSRFLAALVDSAIKAVTIILIYVLAGVANSSVAVGVAILLIFLVFFGYDVLFETKASGRTPGKRVTGLRVVRRGGGPVGFRTSAVRNLLRLVDILPGSYLVGIICVL